MRTRGPGPMGDYVGGRGVVTQSPPRRGGGPTTGSSYSFVGAILIALFEIIRNTLRTDIIRNKTLESIGNRHFLKRCKKYLLHIKAVTVAPARPRAPGRGRARGHPGRGRRGTRPVSGTCVHLRVVWGPWGRGPRGTMSGAGVSLPNPPSAGGRPYDW